tara:strand:+ start:217 stop:378 length:162 start_codon:yes stop_codon:yes gene_type:complete
MTTDMILLDVDIADLAAFVLRTEGFDKEALVIEEELAYYMDRKRTAKQEREQC